MRGKDPEPEVEELVLVSHSERSRKPLDSRREKHTVMVCYKFKMGRDQTEALLVSLFFIRIKPT